MCAPDPFSGGGGVNPFPAAPLTGLGTSPVFLNGATIPEPSAIALGIAGAVLALLRLRRRSCNSESLPERAQGTTMYL
jgi:hypothetical protein